MKTVLVAMNAKYIHTNLAVRYLRAMEPRLEVLEFSINEPVSRISSEIFSKRPELVLFSVYLWNAEMIRKISEMLKKADRTITIALGGMEAYLNPHVWEDNPNMDFLLAGEGEEYLSAFLDEMERRGSGFPAGVISRGEPIKVPFVADLNSLPFPYQNGEPMQNRIVYYESSRGCPYRCGFCLSAASAGVRYLPIDRVKRELSYFIEQGVPLVKLVDRTFNSDNHRAAELVEFIKSQAGKTKFHFEIKAEAASDAFLHSLETAPPGMFQLEIGVQSTNPDTLALVNRNHNFDKIRQVVTRLLRNRNIHLHLDLIAGLPKEDYATFLRSFRDVYHLKPDDLQLGFLKKLHGARMEFDYGSFQSFPPYEVIATDVLPFEKLCELKKAADMLERYYNSGAFANCLSYLVETYFLDNPYELYRGLAEFSAEHGEASVSRKTAYRLLLDYINQEHADNTAAEYLRFDYFLHHGDMPPFFRQDHLKEKVFSFLKQDQLVKEFFPELLFIKPAERYKRVKAASFRFDVRTGENRPVVLIALTGTGHCVEIPREGGGVC